LDYRVYALLGDGECNEGSVWEAAMAAAKYKLNNLRAIVDINGQSLDGFTSDIMPINNFRQVFEGFGWNVVEVNGNDIEQMEEVFFAINSQNNQDKPVAILCYTLKGKGLKSIEGKVGWHHTRLSQDDYNAFCNELRIQG
jgi:transketolase